MLIRFHVSNYLSFNDEVELSMVSGKTRKHPNHVMKGSGRHDLAILRAAVIYGANASGKSNLIKAMDFARRQILAGTHAKEAIPRQPFKLIWGNAGQPSKFEFEFKHKTHSYIYGFTLDSRRIHEEWLYEIRKTTGPDMLFERTTTPEGKTSIKFDKIKFTSRKEENFLDFVAMGTRPNQLFLTESIERDAKHFEDVYRWFDEKLVIIFPLSRYLRLGAFDKDKKLNSILVRYLEQFGTGICGFGLAEVTPEIEFPGEMLADMLKNAQSEPVIITVVNSDGDRFCVEVSENAEIKAHKLMLKHKMGACDDEALLDMSEESDGTRRLLDLIPFLILAENDKVFVVDELDRSLHPNLSRQFVELFMDGKNQSQLILTTHESGLLDLNLLRRDEIWFVEKDQNGASSVYSLEEFTPRYDKDIKKGYLLGRFGAIPVLGNISLS